MTIPQQLKEMGKKTNSNIKASTTAPVKENRPRSIQKDNIDASKGHEPIAVLHPSRGLRPLQVTVPDTSTTHTETILLSNFMKQLERAVEIVEMK